MVPEYGAVDRKLLSSASTRRASELQEKEGERNKETAEAYQ